MNNWNDASCTTANNGEVGIHNSDDDSVIVFGDSDNSITVAGLL